MNKDLTILIAAAQEPAREAWGYMLQRNPVFDVIVQAIDRDETHSMTRLWQPQVIILDFDYPEPVIIGMISGIRQYLPGSKILAVAAKAHAEYAQRMIRFGAAGCITRESDSRELYKAIMEVYLGRHYVCDEIKNNIAEGIISSRQRQDGINSLTPKEVEVITYLKNGESSREIARKLKTALKTIQVHRYNIKKKLNLKSGTMLRNYFTNYQLELDEMCAV